MRNSPGGDVRFSDAKNRLFLISWFYLMSLSFPFGGITKRRGCTALIYAPHVTARWVSQVRHGALCLWGENGSPGWTSLLRQSFELSPFAFLPFANMFTQCHGACLRACLLVYLMAGMLAHRVNPVRVMATIKTEAFWWHSRRRFG